MRYIFFFLLWVIGVSLQAQKPIRPVLGVPIDSLKSDTIGLRAPSLVSSWVGADSNRVEMFLLDDVSSPTVFSDTLPGESFSQSDIAMKHDLEYIHLGNAGSSAVPIHYDYKPSVGYRSGIAEYDLYRYTLDRYPVYEVRRAFTDGHFSPRGDRNNFVVGAKFANRFKNDVLISANYDRIAQQGQYANQGIKNSTLGVTLYQKSISSKYQAYLTFLNHAVTENYNGGVVENIDVSKIASSDRAFINTVLTTAQSRYHSRELYLHQRYQISQRSWWLTMRTGYSDIYRRYSDTRLSPTQNDYYGQAVTDARGIRSIYDDYHFENAIGVESVTDGSRTSFQLVYDHTTTADDFRRIRYHDVQFLAQGKYTLSDTYTIFGKARYGILDADNTYHLQAGANAKLGAIHLSLRADMFSNRPSFRETYLTVSQKEVWSHNFTNTSGSQLQANVEIPQLGVRVSYNRYDLRGPIFYHNGTFRQSDSYTTDRVTLSWKYQYGVIGTSSTAMYQRSQYPYYLPDLYFKSTVYSKFYLFKRALLLDFGCGVMYIPDHVAPSFFSLVGTYHASEKRSSTYFRPYAYVSGKVESFRFFVRVHNPKTYIDNDPSMPVYRYPIPDAHIRFGVRWIFRN